MLNWSCCSGVPVPNSVVFAASRRVGVSLLIVCILDDGIVICASLAFYVQLLCVGRFFGKGEACFFFVVKNCSCEKSLHEILPQIMGVGV